MRFFLKTFYPLTFAGVSMWDKSAATPTVCTISYNDNSVTRGLFFRSNDNGCPIPPLAPATATLTLFYNNNNKKKTINLIERNLIISTIV